MAELVRVCANVLACARVRVHACASVSICAGVRACVRACVRAWVSSAWQFAATTTTSTCHYHTPLPPPPPATTTRNNSRNYHLPVPPATTTSHYRLRLPLAIIACPGIIQPVLLCQYPRLRCAQMLLAPVQARMHGRECTYSRIRALLLRLSIRPCGLLLHTTQPQVHARVVYRHTHVDIDTHTQDIETRTQT